MPTTTPNYGWTVPTSTDYVAQGAVAIETLGDSADATVFSVTNGRGVGCSLIARNSFSAQTTVSFSSIFTSTFDNYIIIANIEAASTSGTLLLRLRSNTTDNSNTSYNRQEFTANSTTLTGGQGASQTAFLAGAYNTAGAASTITLYNPNEVQYTYATAEGVSPTTNITMVKSVGFFVATTAFNGFSILAASGNITGTIKVYGMRKLV